MTRVRVDFNSRGPGGLVRGSRRRADGELAEGERVELYDPDEADMVFSARVVRLDAEEGTALFDVDWETAPAGGSSGPYLNVAGSWHDVFVIEIKDYGKALTPPQSVTSAAITMSS